MLDYLVTDGVLQPEYGNWSAGVWKRQSMRIELD
jgi:hypothetical protein